MFALLQPTPDTSGYFIAGYIIIFGVMLLYLISLMVRNRNLKQDMEVLAELEKEGQKRRGNQGDLEGLPSTPPQPR